MDFCLKCGEPLDDDDASSWPWCPDCDWCPDCPHDDGRRHSPGWDAEYERLARRELQHRNT